MTRRSGERLQKLRVEVRNGRGDLDDVKVALGRLGAEVRHVAGREADLRLVVDLTVALTIPLDLPALAYAVRGTGADLLQLGPADPGGLGRGATAA